MARPRTSPKVNVTAAFDLDFVTWADGVADETGSTRSQVIRDMATDGRKMYERKKQARAERLSPPEDLPFKEN